MRLIFSSEFACQHCGSVLLVGFDQPDPDEWAAKVAAHMCAEGAAQEGGDRG